LAYKLLQILEAKRGKGKIGTIRWREERNCCILQIYSIDGLTYIINLLSGRLRTPKAYQIGIIMDWLNKQHGREILHLSKNNTDISDDAWFAGFTHAVSGSPKQQQPR
jgi:hypothetical protein